MTQDIQMARSTQYSSALAVGGDDWSQPPVAATQPQAVANPIKRIQRLLRGRYLLAFTLAAIGATAGGLAGYLIPKPYYTSTGWIQISPVKVNPLGSTDQTIPLFYQYVSSQVQILRSQRVVSQAMNSNEWKAIKKNTPGVDPFAEFQSNLDVSATRDSFLISVTYADLDPTVAQAAIKAMMSAYETLYAEIENDEGRRKLTALESTQTTMSNKLAQKQEELNKLASDFGTNDLSMLHGAKQVELSRKEQELEALTAQMKQIDDSMASETGIPSLSDSDIARAGDQTMLQMLQHKAQAEMLVDALRAQLGEAHPKVVEARRQLDGINASIKKYGDDFRKQYIVFIPGFGAERPSLLTKKDVDIFRDRVKSAEKALVKVKDETNDIAKRRYVMDTKRTEIDKLKSDYDMVSRRLEQVSMQVGVTGQVKVLSRGDIAAAPTVDRRKQMTLLGVLGGGSLPIALLVLIGLIDSRYRYSDDANATMSGIPLLGILPNLPDLLTDPEQAAMAAHCVHQIRTMLQISADSQDRRVFCVTSPSPGDGKTSLTLALGLSFATAGSRTLLIDLDLVGAGLTSRMSVNSQEGILEAVNNRSILPYVQSTDITDLSILPVGRASARHASMLSPAVVRKLVTEARNHFDTVLIDTGPILGSIEASPVCVSADAVILAVARGQQRPLVERALNHLMSIGARLAGVVFNRAQARDFEQSVSRISMRSLRAPVNGNGHGPHDPATGRPPERRQPQLGPVARAVAKSVHSGPTGNGDNHG